jgi:hypothetical protein
MSSPAARASSSCVPTRYSVTFVETFGVDEEDELPFSWPSVARKPTRARMSYHQVKRVTIERRRPYAYHGRELEKVMDAEPRPHARTAGLKDDDARVAEGGHGRGLSRSRDMPPRRGRVACGCVVQSRTSEILSSHTAATKCSQRFCASLHLRPHYYQSSAGAAYRSEP